MHLATTTQSLELLLGGAVAANQLPFVADYADCTTSLFTPGQQNGASNNGSAVAFLSAPAASTQRILRSLTIYNEDTAVAVVTIRLNDNGTLRTIKAFTLAAGDQLSYSDDGWEIADNLGRVKFTDYEIAPQNSIRRTAFFNPQNITTTITITSGRAVALEGPVESALTSIQVQWSVPATALSGATWAEIAIARELSGPIGGTPSNATVLGCAAHLIVVGFADITGIANSTGLKTTTVTLSGVRPGDRLWVLFGQSGGTGAVLRAVTAEDFDTVSGASWTPNATTRPSLMVGGPPIECTTGVVTQPWIAAQV